MATNTTREKRIEDMLWFIMEKEGYAEEFVSWRDLHTEEFNPDIDNLEIRKYHRLSRCEERLELILKKRGWLEEYNKMKLEKIKNDILRKRDLALLSDNDEDLKSRAILFYSNMKREEGEPVFFDKKWVYIDPPALRNKSVIL